MAVKTGDDLHRTAGVTDAFNQSCFIPSFTNVFTSRFSPFSMGKGAFHSELNLIWFLSRQCPGLHPAHFHHAVIVRKCLVDLPDLFEFLLRKDVGAAPTQAQVPVGRFAPALQASAPSDQVESAAAMERQRDHLRYPGSGRDGILQVSSRASELSISCQGNPASRAIAGRDCRRSRPSECSGHKLHPAIFLRDRRLSTRHSPGGVPRFGVCQFRVAEYCSASFRIFTDFRMLRRFARFRLIEYISPQRTTRIFDVLSVKNRLENFHKKSSQKACIAPCCALSQSTPVFAIRRIRLLAH